MRHCPFEATHTDFVADQVSIPPRPVCSLTSDQFAHSPRNISRNTIQRNARNPAKEMQPLFLHKSVGISLEPADNMRGAGGECSMLTGSRDRPDGGFAYFPVVPLMGWESYHQKILAIVSPDIWTAESLGISGTRDQVQSVQHTTELMCAVLPQSSCSQCHDCKECLSHLDLIQDLTITCQLYRRYLESTPTHRGLSHGYTSRKSPARLLE